VVLQLQTIGGERREPGSERLTDQGRDFCSLIYVHIDIDNFYIFSCHMNNACPTRTIPHIAESRRCKMIFVCINEKHYILLDKYFLYNKNFMGF
jgi:hypothetical protein